MSHSDIRIGTLAGLSAGANYLKQILPQGFESFSLTAWLHVGEVDLAKTAKECLDVIGDKAVISSIGVFGNPLQDDVTRKDWERIIDSAKLFGCDVVCGFSGAIESKPVDQQMPEFKSVWEPLAKRAKDNGLRIAFENCDMGGTWQTPRFNLAHAPAAWELIWNELSAFDNVGLEWEPCHQMNSLIDPIPQLRELVKTGKIFHVHGKDATVAWDVVKKYGTRGGEPYVWHRTPGFGDTNWTDIISILRMSKYRGTIDIEGWHDPVYRDDLEMTGQVFGLNYLKHCRGGPFVANPK